MTDISVVVPSYNRADVLLGTILSLFNQTVLTKFQVEVLVSIDSSDEQIDQYKSYVKQLNHIAKDLKPNLEVKLIVNKTNGLLSAKNNAVENAQSDYIMMIDDDLFMEPKYIEELFIEISHSPEIGAISGYIVSHVSAISHTQPSDKIEALPEEILLQTLKLEKDPAGNWKSLFGKKEQVMDWSEINKTIDPSTRYEMDYFVNSYMFKKKVFEQIGGYNVDLNSKTSAHEEVDFTYRMKKSGKKLIFNPLIRMWHLTIGKGGIYKGKDWDESKDILEKEYTESIDVFLNSISKI